MFRFHWCKMRKDIKQHYFNRYVVLDIDKQDLEYMYCQLATTDLPEGHADRGIVIRIRHQLQLALRRSCHYAQKRN